MTMKYTLLVLLLAVLSACANPFNRATSDRYALDCSAAEQKGNLQSAEQLCYSAIVNVDWVSLGSELKSQRLYNLGRIKRQLAKFSEAEPLMKESLELEDKLSGPYNEKVGRRLAELSAILAGQDKWGEGIPIVERLIPFSGSFSGSERAFVAQTFQQYAAHARQSGKAELASTLEAVTKALAQPSQQP
jgi:hypothetical protein